MKKFILYFSVLLFVFLIACKKSEEQKPAGESAPKSAQMGGERAKHKRRAAPAVPLQIYHEESLVKSVDPKEYPGLATSKMKIGDKEVSGFPLKELLAKYQLKGKNVIIAGAQRSATITWEQANSDGIFVFIGTKQNTLQISAPKTLNLNLPNRLVRLTVSDRAPTAANGQSKKTGK